MASSTSSPSDEIPVEVLDKRNYVPEPPEDIQGLSSRVWVGDLPHTTTKRSVLNAVRGEGGVTEILKACINVPMPDGSSKRAAIFAVTFASVEHARRFISFTTRYGILFQPGDGAAPSERAVDRPAAVSGAAYAYPIKRCNLPALTKSLDTAIIGFTRVWELDLVPKKAVWFILNCVGLKDILHATYSTSDSKLRVEFVSTFAASNAAHRILWFGLPYLLGHPIPSDGMTDGMRFGNNPILRYVPDSCNGSLQHLRDQPYYTPKLSDTEYIEKFSVLPYNVHWPARFHPCMAHASVEVRTANQRWVMLKELDTGYLGGNIWSWEVPAGARDAVLHLMDTVLHPEWASIWSRFMGSSNSRLWNMTRLAYYGEVVEHRKRMRGMCPGDCPYGCNMSRAPIPQVVQDYWDGKIETTGERSEESDPDQVTQTSGCPSMPQPEPDSYDGLQPLFKFKRHCEAKDKRVLAAGSDSGYSGAGEEVQEDGPVLAATPLSAGDAEDDSSISSDGPSTVPDNETFSIMDPRASMEEVVGTNAELFGRDYD